MVWQATWSSNLAPPNHILSNWRLRLYAPTLICWPCSLRVHTSTSLLSLEPPQPHPHKFGGPGAIARTPAQVCWPWSHRAHTNTGLVALESPHPHQHKFVSPGVIAPYQRKFTACVSKPCSLTVLQTCSSPASTKQEAR